MNTQPITLDVDGARRFHGHSCPGLAMGIRVAEAALRWAGAPAADEEVVCVAEADHCGVDGIQYLVGCTFGKGNLIHHDYGKSVFTFFRRSDGRGALRVAARPEFWNRSDPQERAILDRQREGEAPSEADRAYLDARRAARIAAIMEAPLEELFDLREIEAPAPDRARILGSVLCAECGEAVMASRVRYYRGVAHCIPCFEALTRPTV